MVFDVYFSFREMPKSEGEKKMPQKMISKSLVSLSKMKGIPPKEHLRDFLDEKFHLKFVFLRNKTAAEKRSKSKEKLAIMKN